MREEFCEYLREVGKAERTWNTYARQIDQLSKDCGENIFELTDVARLRPLVRQYDSGGPRYDVGNLEHGGPRAAIKQYLAFLERDYYERFDSDDAAYLSWLKSHPNGFVLNANNPPRPDNLVLHGASCVSIADKIGTAYLKICAAKESGLQRWFAEQKLDGATARHQCVGRVEAYGAEGNIKQVANQTDTQSPLNQILYGPPGTGKTHHTVDETLAILDQKFLDENGGSREALKGRFDELHEQGRVRFVTFHQSFSYEDFVEGLRAVPAEDGTLKYMPVDGVFKALCEGATAKVVLDQEPVLALKDGKIWKMSLGGNEEAQIYDECIQKGRILLGWGGEIDFSGCKDKADIVSTFRSNGAIYETSSYAVTAVAAFRLKMKVGDLVIVPDGNFKFRAIGQVTGDYQSIDRTVENDDYGQCRNVRWLKVFEPSASCDLIMNKDFMMKTIYQLHPQVADQQRILALVSAKSESETLTDPALPKVLVIDEINRGNISRIFGELITLIEPSKRSGSPEALHVTLPYSKDRFSVPANLHIIGTMNTADRSLAGLDMALRRRFTFKEMPPRPELLDSVMVGGVNIGELLRVLNQRIEVLLDRDHCIGHAYFMPLREQNTLPKLASIFERQIIPLLQEYFFEDWERIAWALNDHRKEAINRFLLEPSVNLAQLFGDECEGRIAARSWELNVEAFDRIEAYAGIVNHAKIVTVISKHVEQEASYKGFNLRQYADETVEVRKGDELQSQAMPILRELAGQLGVSVLNSKSNPFNTRQLGRRVILKIREQA